MPSAASVLTSTTQTSKTQSSKTLGSPTATLSPALTGQSLYKTLAENIFLDLKASGLRDKEIVAVSSELLSRLTADIVARVAETAEAGRIASEAPTFKSRN